MDELRFTVVGVPTPKGSTRSFVIQPKNGGKPRAVTTGDNPKTKGWQQSIAQVASIELNRGIHSGQRFDEGPIALDVTFYLPRPKALLTKRNASIDHPHVKKPDTDKLARACKDALTGVVWTDDSQVTDLSARKRYCAAGEWPRAEISIRAASTQHGSLLG